MNKQLSFDLDKELLGDDYDESNEHHLIVSNKKVKK